MSVQLELFEMGHAHVYETWRGPIKVDPVIELPHDGSKWCWDCSSWVNRAGVSQYEAWTTDGRALAVRYARMVKAGTITRHEAINFYYPKANFRFGEAVTAIDIAIGDINEGIV